MCEKLLKLNADPFLENKYGKSAYSCAKLHESNSVIKIFTKDIKFFQERLDDLEQLLSECNSNNNVLSYKDIKKSIKNLFKVEGGWEWDLLKNAVFGENLNKFNTDANVHLALYRIYLFFNENHSDFKYPVVECKEIKKFLKRALDIQGTFIKKSKYFRNVVEFKPSC